MSQELHGRRLRNGCCCWLVYNEQMPTAGFATAAKVWCNNTALLLARAGSSLGWEACVPCVSCAFLSPLLKFFHQLARSLFCSTLSFWAGGAGLGPPPPACAVDGPPLAMADGDVSLLPTATANPSSRTVSATVPSKVRGRQCRRVEDENDALRACRDAQARGRIADVEYVVCDSMHQCGSIRA